eukprot:2088819-Prorocentrum_lima.AAC.1
MTSSLVGSEMCIRDRVLGLVYLHIYPILEFPRPVKPFGKFERNTRPKPVSYTHLTLPTICSV